MTEFENIKAGDEVFVFANHYDRQPKRCKVERVLKMRIVVDGEHYTRRGRCVGGCGARHLRAITPEFEKYLADIRAEDEDRETLRRLRHRLDTLASAAGTAVGTFRPGRRAEIAALEAAIGRAEDLIRPALAAVTVKR